MRSTHTVGFTVWGPVGFWGKLRWLFTKECTTIPRKYLLTISGDGDFTLDRIEAVPEGNNA